MPFDLRHLRYVIAAADHGSFYRAARAIGVEQSTLSRCVLRLERTIGSQIFRRSRAGVTPTTAGVKFISTARPLLASADRLAAAMRDAGQGRAGSFRFGLNSSVSAGKLRSAILDWAHDNGSLEVQGIEGDRNALLAGLNVGDVDIAILVGEGNQNGFRSEPLWSERLFVALPTAHSLAATEIVHWTDLRDEHFILPEADPGPDIRDMLLGRLSRSGNPSFIAFSRTSRETILSLLGAGKSLTVVCEGSTGAAYPDVVYRPIHGEQGPATIGFSGYWLAENDNPPLRRFLTFIRQRYALPFTLLAERN